MKHECEAPACPDEGAEQTASGEWYCARHFRALETPSWLAGALAGAIGEDIEIALGLVEGNHDRLDELRTWADGPNLYLGLGGVTYRLHASRARRNPLREPSKSEPRRLEGSAWLAKTLEGAITQGTVLRLFNGAEHRLDTFRSWHEGSTIILDTGVRVFRLRVTRCRSRPPTSAR